jgi:3-phosphoshikimate 1-carboxyvinyltransferase
MSLRFRGTLPGSKSLFIRALVAGSYAPELEVTGHSDSEDVALARRGLRSLRDGGVIECGDAGAVLRFLALRASRLPGEHALVGSERLFSRPLTELRHTLGGLGAATDLEDRRLVVRSEGWDAAEVIVDCSRSSQFASGVLANCWGLAGPLTLGVENLSLSRGYWDMTVDVVQRLGMDLQVHGDRVLVPPRQLVTATSYEVEVDMGCAFAVAAVATVDGEATIEDFPSVSLQPDARFVELLAQMGAAISFESGALRVGKASRLSGIDVHLGGSPDLFPVMAALAGAAGGNSRLGGAPQLRYKESDRVAKTAELVSGMGRQVEVRDDGIHISGATGPAERFTFNADQDHRMAMAAAVAHHAGAPVTITGAESVAKSFGGFWDIVGWRP